MNLYDDPYVMCVCSLIANHTRPEIRRMMVDDAYVANLILKETRLTDFRGPFLDAIVETILTDKHRMQMMGELDKLSLYFFKNLDLNRFRETIVYIDGRYNLGIFDEENIY